MEIFPFDYDKAFTKKVKSVYVNSVFATPENAFAEAQYLVQDEGTQEVSFPLVSFYRVNWSIDPNFYNEHAFRRGSYQIPNTETYLEGENLKTLPIKINYQLDIWGPDSDVVDRLTTEFIFLFFRFPNLKLEFEEMSLHNLKDCKITLNDVLENSAFNDKFESGRLFRSTFDLSVDNAVIAQSAPYKVVKTVDVKQIAYKVDKLSKKFVKST